MISHLLTPILFSYKKKYVEIFQKLMFRKSVVGASACLFKCVLTPHAKSIAVYKITTIPTPPPLADTHQIKYQDWTSSN